MKKGSIHTEETKRRISESVKGTIHSEEVRKRMSTAMKGVKRSEETKRRISKAKKGMKHSEETKKRMSDAKKGKGYNKNLIGIKRSEETKEKLSIANKGKISGKKHWNWKGGNGSIYSAGFTLHLKRKVNKRDGYKCIECSSDKSLLVHHIDFGKDNHSMENLETLCKSCHTKKHKKYESNNSKK